MSANHLWRAVCRAIRPLGRQHRGRGDTVNPATLGPHPARPVSAPAYYLGRPASVWIAAARRRRAAA